MAILWGINCLIVINKKEKRNYCMSECNGCCLERMKAKYGKKLIKYKSNWFLKNASPVKGQGAPFELPDGSPIRFIAWFMSEEHCCGK